MRARSKKEYDFIIWDGVINANKGIFAGCGDCKYMSMGYHAVPHIHGKNFFPSIKKGDYILFDENGFAVKAMTENKFEELYEVIK
jgi:hypothetical protein